ncbi:hypothetical protein CL657_01025 [bacterium]|nr:hypothetical protein [bacterium]
MKIVVKYLWLYIVCIVDLCNSFTVSSSRFSQWIFREVKWILFVIDGACKHSGNCCKSIQISYDFFPIKTINRFNAICNHDSNMTRFIPNVKNDAIDFFDCRCLTSDNYCSSYQSRPKFCVQYPRNILFSDAQLYEGCGYYLKQVIYLPFFSSSSLKKKIMCFKFNNHLS